MQRKNNFLKFTSAKRGIAMIMAVGVILIVSTLMAIALAMSTRTSKSTINLYLHEQAQLLAKSAVEITLLYISLENNATNPCNVTSLTFTENKIYDVNVSVLYSYYATATEPLPASCNGKTYATVTSKEQNGSVLLDISVSVNDESVTTEPIRYFKRTIQKL
jgi:hypothetical protein